MRPSRLLTPMIVGLLAMTACSSDDAPEDAAAAESTPEEQATAPAAQASHRVPVVLDYSPTVSDATALLYLTQHPDVDLLAVTLAGTGEARCEAAIPITRELLEIGGRGDVPIACGPDEPVGPGNAWPDEWRARAEALLDLEDTAAHDLEDTASDAPTDTGRDAADLLAEVAAAAGEPITIVAVGPLTNLALAVESHPDLVENVAMIYSMGGAADVDGNAPNGVAEWNYYVDPTAVDVVVRSGLPFTMVPLDATNDVPSTKEWFDLIARHHTTGAATAVYDLFAATEPFEIGFSFWDELAAATALDESLVTIEEQTIMVEVAGEQQGQTRADNEGVAVRVAVAADRDRFEQHLLTTLNGGTAVPETAPVDPEEVEYFESVAASAAAMDDAFGALFSTPLAQEMDRRFEDDSTTAPDDEDFEVARQFIEEFWNGAIDLLTVQRDELKELGVPESLVSAHDDYLAAIDVLIGSRDKVLAAVASADGPDTLDLLWDPGADIQSVDDACANLQREATERGLSVELCPQG